MSEFCHKLLANPRGTPVTAFTWPPVQPDEHFLILEEVMLENPSLSWTISCGDSFKQVLEQAKTFSLAL